MDAVFSNLLLVDECLLDAKRVREFKSAINKSVRPGDIVVDAGTGSGIIALIAARAGAKKVYALV
jgi:predicted RNA methylase